MVLEKKISRKEQIYSTSTRMFMERGYRATSMRDLAKELQIEAPSLYSHIKSKEEILQKVCMDTAHTFFKGLENIEKTNFSAKARLQAGIQSHILVICNNLEAVSVFLTEWRHLSEPCYTDFSIMRKQYENSFRSYISFGVEKGEFMVEDIDFAVLTILSSLNWTSNWYKPEGKMTPRIISDNLSAILIKGIS